MKLIILSLNPLIPASAWSHWVVIVIICFVMIGPLLIQALSQLTVLLLQKAVLLLHLGELLLSLISLLPVSL